MRPSSLASANQPTPGPAWHTLVEFSLPSELSSEGLARAKLAEAVQGLSLPAASLERLKMVVAEATLNAIEHGQRYRSNAPMVIRVLVSDRSLPMHITDQDSGGSLPKLETPTDLATQLADQQPSRGWGFFLIEKMAEELQLSGDEAHHTIELFLY